MWTEYDSAVTSPAESGLTFATLQASVRRNCNNLPTQHIHYASVPTYINEAVDEFMTLAISPNGKKLLDLMPRFANWRWYDVTVNGQGYLAMPASMLTLDSVSVTRLTTAYNPTVQQEFPVVPEPDAVTFGLISKSTPGWPVRYRRAGANIEFDPTPSSSPTNYLTQVVVRGYRREDALVNAGDTLKMNVKLQNMVVELATAITMEKMGWEAGRRTLFDERMARYLNVTAQERLRSPIRTTIAGMPR